MLYDVLDSNGNVINTIVLDNISEWTPPEGCTIRPHTGPAPHPINNISPISFKLRFTSTERVAIYSAVDTDPVIKDWVSILDDQRLTTVDLTSDGTKDAVAYLVTKKILTQSRANKILEVQFV